METTHEAALAYRSSEEGLRSRRAELLLQRRAEIEALPKTASTIYARRISRMAAGATLTICAALIPTTAIGQYIALQTWNAREGFFTGILLAAPVLATLAWFIAGPIAAAGFRRRLLRTVRPTDDLIADVDRLSRHSAEAIADEHADRLERPSVSWPLIGLAVTVPLLLHFPVWLLIRSSSEGIFTEFDNWILISLVLVTHCHVLLAFLAWRFARNLRNDPLRTIPSRSGWFAWLWTWASSAVPGAVLLLIPVGITLVTGLVFVPLSFAVIGNKARAERAQLESSQLVRN